MSREIQNIKKAIEELRSETRQLENNLDYFSNTSNDNPLFQDVTSRLNDLNAEIDNHKEKLVGLRKFKREIEARDTISSEENETQSGGRKYHLRIIQFFDFACCQYTSISAMLSSFIFFPASDASILYE